MKRNDIVTVNDFSWFAVLGADTHGYVKDCTKHYKVLDVGCHFPLTHGQFEKYRSDTTIQAIKSGEVLVIHGAFLKPVPPKHKIIIDIKFGIGSGNVVEISDKLYKEIKRDTQD